MKENHKQNKRKNLSRPFIFWEVGGNRRIKCGLCMESTLPAPESPSQLEALSPDPQSSSHVSRGFAPFSNQWIRDQTYFGGELTGLPWKGGQVNITSDFWSRRPLVRSLEVFTLFFFCVCMGLGFEFKASCLLGRHSTTWAALSVLFCDGFFSR
jgi:hypothetical protein